LTTATFKAAEQKQMPNSGLLSMCRRYGRSCSCHCCSQFLEKPNYMQTRYQMQLRVNALVEVPCCLQREPAALVAGRLSLMPGNAAPVPALHMPASLGRAAHALAPADASRLLLDASVVLLVQYALATLQYAMQH
jgi:hypothetical protein